ncbi:hypothetical protein G7068_07025 [Leucobacter viscericola]|uniref:SLH domain-containing protein n=1 Tax=Leucobacter viscericola TaxID=2714935 RepID=A0A6G7XEF5_9MICO|nr:HtaA domain-containing protein [Leucobacter viscericola]QIK62974.1 hypothetical protein G7068_07025 [Leucobacter viscericola]
MVETQKKPRGRVTSLLATVTAALVVASGLGFAPAVANAADPAVQTASLSWGVKSSFASYIKSPIAHGTITNLGATTGQFDWANGTGTATGDGSSFDVSFGAGNGMHFLGHEIDGVSALDMQFTNPRVKLTSATTADLYLDVKSRKFEGMSSASDEFFEQDGVRFATVTLPAPTVNGSALTWTNAATELTTEGFDAFGGFYPAGTALDPLTLTVGNWAPALGVFLADGTTPVGNSVVHAGDKLIVKGTGFDPTANVGGRGVPIPDTLPQGSYVVFGNFGSSWKPSSGAASATRKVGAQGWALTSATVDAVPAQYQATIRNQWVELAGDGNFAWEVTLKNPAELAAGGAYGIYTYGAGGVNNASQELGVALNYDPSQRTTTTLAVAPANSATIGTSTKLTATVAAGEGTPAGTVAFFNGTTQVGQTQPLNAGSASVTVSNLPAGSAKLQAKFTPADATAFAASESAVSPFQVNKIASSVALEVMVALPSGNGSGEGFQSVGATVKIASGAKPAGTVTLFSGKQQIGTPQKVNEDGFASLPSDLLKPGTHSLTAKFTPSDSSKIAESTSKALSFVVDSPTAKIVFSDVKKSDKFYKEISWMASSGLSTGTKQANGTYLYKPADAVSREAMAAFLYREAKANYKGPKVSPFADVKPGDKFYNEIAWMYKEGISTGTRQATGKPLFKAKDGISREAMAAFMYRIDTKAKPKTPTVSPFSDVKPSDKFYKEIAWMYSSGLSTGTKQASGKPRYEAKANVSRSAMAAFLYRKAH